MANVVTVWYSYGGQLLLTQFITLKNGFANTGSVRHCKHCWAANTLCFPEGFWFQRHVSAWVKLSSGGEDIQTLAAKDRMLGRDSGNLDWISKAVSAWWITLGNHSIFCAVFSLLRNRKNKSEPDTFWWKLKHNRWPLLLLLLLTKSYPALYINLLLFYREATSGLYYKVHTM